MTSNNRELSCAVVSKRQRHSVSGKEIVPGISAMYRSYINSHGSSNRKLVRDFLLVFRCNYMSIFCRFRDTTKAVQQIHNISKCQNVVDLLWDLQQVYNKSKQWSLGVDLLCTSLQQSTTSLEQDLNIKSVKRPLHNLYVRIGKRELFWLRTLRDDWSVILAWYFLLFVVCSSLSFFLLFYFLSRCIFSVCCLMANKDFIYSSANVILVTQLH